MDTHEPEATPDDATPARRLENTSVIESINRKRGLLVAGAAFAIAVVVVGLVLVANNQDRDVEPAGPAQVVQTFIHELERLDGSAVEDLVSPEATAMYLGNFGYNEQNPGTIQALWDWGAIYHMTYAFDGCTESNASGGPPPSEQQTGSGVFFTCNYTLENDWTRAFGLAAQSGRFRMEVTDGEITRLTEDYPFEAQYDAWAGVVDWVQTNHPEDVATMFLDAPPGGLARSGKLTPESIALWRAYTPLMIQSLGPPDRSTTTSLPQGSGDALSFASADSPDGAQLYEGAMVGGDFIAVSRTRGVWKTADAVGWETLGSLPEIPPTATRMDVASDGSRLAVLEYGGCVGSDSAMYLSVRETDGGWSSHEMPLRLPGESSDVGCLHALQAHVTVGPEGFLVTASLAADIQIEQLIADALGLDRDVVEEGLTSLNQRGTTVEVDLDGQTSILDFEQLGYAEDIARFADQVSGFINTDGSDMVTLGEATVAWRSADAESWTALDPPRLLATSVATAAGPGGFIVTSNGMIWSTQNGQEWTEIGEVGTSVPSSLVEWGGQTLLLGDGVWLVDDELALVSEDLELGEPYTFAASGLGVVGKASFSNSLVYSADGVTWSSWVPTEFSSSNGLVNLVGVGDGFVVMIEEAFGVPPILWIGRVG